MNTSGWKPIDPSRLDRFTWKAGDVQLVSRASDKSQPKKRQVAKVRKIIRDAQEGL